MVHRDHFLKVNPGTKLMSRDHIGHKTWTGGEAAIEYSLVLHWYVHRHLSIYERRRTFVAMLSTIYARLEGMMSRCRNILIIRVGDGMKFGLIEADPEFRMFRLLTETNRTGSRVRRFTGESRLLPSPTMRKETTSNYTVP